jgi:hypothetical protein
MVASRDITQDSYGTDDRRDGVGRHRTPGLLIQRMLLCLASLRDWVRFTNRLRNIEHIVLLQSIRPFSAPGGTLLFYLPSMLNKRTRVVITTNMNFSEWLILSWPRIGA